MGITVNASEVLVFQRLRQKGSKSREEKMERQQSRDNQVEALEKQKADLKNMECGSVEEIKDKLEVLHSYDDQIAAVKQAYNYEQMHHILDEAREKGEKIAEEIKKLTPKTEEEREEILREEALGIEEDQGLLSEVMEELAEEVTEETAEEITEKITEEAAEELTEETVEELPENTAELPEDSITEEALAMHGKAGDEVSRYLDYYKLI